MAYTEAQKRATMNYRKRVIRRFTFDFNKEYDSDILEMLDAVDNRTSYIKELIRADIEKERRKMK